MKEQPCVGCDETILSLRKFCSVPCRRKYYGAYHKAYQKANRKTDKWKLNRKKYLLQKKEKGTKGRTMNYGIIILSILFILFFVQPALAQPPWYNTDWVYRKNITFNSSLIAWNNLTDFPVLISISDSDLSRFAEPSGYDILFTSSDGTTKLDHEIENYTAGGLVAWVRIPNLYNTTNQTIFMYYNASGAANQQNRTGVWNQSYLAVWHFSEGAGIRLNDSTRYNNNGTLFGSVRWNTTGTAGSIGGALDFNGVDSRINITSNGIIDNLIDFSVTAWIRLDAYGGTTSVGRIVDKQRTGVAGGWMFSPCNGNTSLALACTSNIRFFQERSVTTGFWASTNNTMRTKAFQQVAFTYNRTLNQNNATFYINGTNAGIQRRDVPAGTYSGDANINLSIGAVEGSTAFFNGMMSELRIHNGSLSFGWVRTEYNNQYIPSTFHNVGVGETLTCNPPLNANTNWTIEASDNCEIVGKNINVTRIHIRGASGYVIFRNSNITSLDCRIEPNIGSLIMLAIEPTVNWGNGC